MSDPVMTAAPRAILLLDTSILGLSMGLVGLTPSGAAQTPIWHRAHLDNAGSIVALSRLLGQALQETGLAREQLAGVAVSVGPGSFTGIKIGLAFAYGLAEAWPTPLPTYGLSALEAAAATLFGGAGALFLPATRTHGYVATHGLPGSPSAARLLDASAPWPEDLNFGPGGPDLVVTGSWPLLDQVLRARGQTPRELSASEVCRAAIYGMAEKVAAAWPERFGSAFPQPRYLRLSTAEEQLARRAGPTPLPPSS